MYLAACPLHKFTSSSAIGAQELTATRAPNAPFQNNVGVRPQCRAREGVTNMPGSPAEIPNNYSDERRITIAGKNVVKAYAGIQEVVPVSGGRP